MLSRRKILMHVVVLNNMFSKPISELSYDDIERLKEDRIEESDIIDYKEFVPEKDESLIKHVCAFANTRGGYLVFGVTEEGDGGCPTEINGIENSSINREKIENKILAYITPRLHVGIKTIQIPKSKKSILVIQIPDSFMRPHYSKDHRYYKRFQLKSEIMTEQEIADMYKNRFSNSDHVNQYVEKLLVNEDSTRISGNIVVIPTNINHRLINTFNEEKIYWIDTIRLTKYKDDHGYSIVPCEPMPSAHGLSHKSYLSNAALHELHIHRNGGIHLHKYFDWCNHGVIYFNDKDLAIRLMELVEFASIIMRKHNYSGELKITVSLSGPSNTALPHINRERELNDRLKLKIEREFPLEHIEQHLEKVAASIMHEVVNCYGIVRCRYYDDNDKWII